MKIKELIEKLSKLNPDATIILQKDSEGNGYSPLYDIEECIYVPETTWFGRCYQKSLTPEMIKNGWSEEDDLYHGDNGVDAVCLEPVN